MIYILLPVHNRRKITERFIECLERQRYSDYHLVLIDDGSVDGTEEMVRKRIKNLTVIRGSGDWWWAGSLQQGINWLKKQDINLSDIILIINDDVVFAENFLNNSIFAFSENRRSLLLAQLLDESTNNASESGVSADLKKQTFRTAISPDEINCCSTRGLFLKYSDLLDIGGFHPLILPHYGSDYEFTIRAYKKGYKLWTTPTVVLLQDKEQTGFHFVSAPGFIEFLKMFFSKKSVQNPIYRSTFVLLTAPKIYAPKLILIIWLRAAKSIFKQLLGWNQPRETFVN